ncbi:unnamed protein product [Zymoseptoria tritici ST99CH_3D7]|uniref:Uncharacterized protein n=1 Tax=Zymoseptoria tritici (strain ST99CH_3D7) TaxID=1276538 RepID=A0A1X7RWP4_ZYMT9|nr:unnamed protein product [Zymoseptoria tritici ST99CH_3D7]
MEPVCQALNLSDEQKCTAPATSANLLFCRLHSKQSLGLYLGYKKRNAAFDELETRLPEWLNNKIAEQPLRNVSFDDVEDEATLAELHNYLYKRYGLLDRVIRARKLHHSHFYPLDLDYGHKTYIDKLTNERFVTLRALERLQKRALEVVYRNQTWLAWVRQQQEEEEKVRENESKQIKREAAMFRRRNKEIESRLRRKRIKEGLRRQEAALEEAFKERQDTSDQQDEEESWDPIEDEVENDRSKFVEMMMHLLWLNPPKETSAHDVDTADAGDPTQQASVEAESNGVENTSHTGASHPAKAMNRNQKKRAKKQAKAKSAAANTGNDGTANDSARIEVNETSEQVSKRLFNGAKFDWQENVRGDVLAGVIDHPHELHGQVLGLPQEEVDQLVAEIGEIKQLLLCRLILSQAALLPAALRAESVEQFFNDPELSSAELRDLCLRLEQPSLQEIRDACADFARDENEEEVIKPDDEQDEQETYDMSIAERSHRVPLWRGKKGARDEDFWKTKHEKELEKRRRDSNEAPPRLDFGEIEDGNTRPGKRVRIKLCGRYIWNQASERTVARRGWLQFAVIAHGTKFGEAIQLCRSWDEFYGLSILNIFGYFPSAGWATWAGDRTRSQFLQLGFVPRFSFLGAHEMSSRAATGARGAGPRTHDVMECKNVICAHIKRNDPVSRRFVQYLNLYSSELCILVRDAKTGRIVVQPPKKEWWLTRTKSGMGRASRSEWQVTSEVNEGMFERLSDTSVFSDFRFSFSEHYDVIVWDTLPGVHPEEFQSRIHNTLIKAYRFTQGIECYSVAAPILKTIRRDPDTGRCRDVREGEESVWDVIQHPDSQSIDFLVEYLDGKVTGRRDMTAEEKHERYYNEIDAAEDEVLFPEELQGQQITAIGDHADRITQALGTHGFNMIRFIKGLDSDDDSDDYASDAEKLNVNRGKRKENGSAPRKDPNRGKVPKSLALRQRNSRFNKARPAGELSEAQIIRKSQNLAEDLKKASAREHKWQVEEDKCPNDFAPDCRCEACNKAEGRLNEWEDDDGWSSDNSLSDPESWESDSDCPMLEEDDLELVETDRQQLKKLKAFVFAERVGREDVEKQFAYFIEREKANVFKPQFHAADLELGHMERYAELQNFREASKRINGWSSYVRGKRMQALMWLGVHLSEHRLVARDIADAFALTGLFFAPHKLCGSEVHDWRETLKNRTKLVDNDYKASQPAYYRDWRSDETQPADFWPPASKHGDAFRPPGGGRPAKAWDAVTRPTIARLYKAGIITPAYFSNTLGRAIARDDPMTGRPSMFIDYRQAEFFGGGLIRGRDHITDYRTIDLLKLARAQLEKAPGSRFALLRVYSHSMFMPLTTALNEELAFKDSRGRAWLWKFYPKDVCGGEANFQETVDGRLRRWKAQLALNVKVRRDIVLVMGKDREELERMMVGTVFAIQTQPWRHEVDFWRSFVDVDLGFLEALDRKWVE